MQSRNSARPVRRRRAVIHACCWSLSWAAAFRVAEHKGGGNLGWQTGEQPSAAALGRTMQPGTFPSFDGHRTTYQCLHPGCHRRLVDADASHKHAISTHASWLQTLPLHAHYCQEVLGTPAAWEAGYVTIAPDGSLGDGSAMRPLDNHQTFHVIVYGETSRTSPPPPPVVDASPPARTAPGCFDQLNESWRPSGAVC